MIAPIHRPSLPAGTHEVAFRFAWAIAGLIEATGRAFNVHPKPPMPGLLLWGYLLRLRNRFLKLWPRLLAGAVPRVRKPRKVVEVAEGGETPVRAKPRLCLPRRRGWLADEIGSFGRNFGGHVELLLNDPEVARLIAASPQALRLLRPLCHALNLHTPALPALPRRQRAKRPVKARPEKVPRLTRKEREAILWYPNSEGTPMKLLPKRLPRD